VKVKELVDLVVALSPQASGLVDSFYALDGGRPYKDLTVEQYTAQQSAAEAAAAKDDALALVVNAAAEAAREEYRKAQSTPETIIAAAVATLGGSS
jgi:hypothetical protein